jgi:ribosomal protein S18 acetylase RimI-like enzyme
MSISLVPASQYTIERLASFYNETRVDYLVPMPMNKDRLAAYVHDFDVNLDHSVVALDDGKVIGLGMLGIRGQRSWITRLGVIPQRRRHGAGEAMLTAMLNTSQALGMEKVILEVIKGNERARALFLKCGFKEQSEYLVLRRAPQPIEGQPQGEATWLNKPAALHFMKSRPRQTWINEFESMTNASDLNGVHLIMPDGSTGWLVFQMSQFTLTHLVLCVERGAPETIGAHLLRHLHQRYPRLDTYAENILVTAPFAPAFLSTGYFEAFRRIEMIRDFKL